MKRILSFLMILALLAGCGAKPAADTLAPSASAPAPAAATPAAPAAEEEKGLNLLDIYAEAPYAFSCLETGGFDTAAESAPTDAELTQMLEFAMASCSAHMLTPAHFVVIRDAAEQADILRGMGMMIGNPDMPIASEGTVTILILADVLRDQEHHEAEYNGWYSQMYYGIFDAGSAMGYLTLAANALGYRTHPYAALNLPVDGEVDITNGGKFSLIQGNNWDVDKYMTSKDGEVDFTHHVRTYAMGSGSTDVKAQGNLTLLATIVIGKNAGVDAATGATYDGKPASNFNFWDPQDGKSYGNSVPAGAGLSSSNGAADFSKLSDGTYTGTGESTSSQYTVEAKVEGGKVISIEVTEGKEKMFGGEEKVDAFIASIIEAQSLEVDGVSGATQDCAGIVSALKEAFAG